MDHEIEHHVHIGAAVLERSEPRGLEKTRHGQNGLQGLHGGVEALQVADLQHASRAPRHLDQSLALRDGRGHGLLDEHVRAGLEKIARNGVMLGRRRDDAHGIDAAQKLAIIGVRRDLEFGSHGLPRLGRGIGDADQLRVRRLSIFLCVKSAEVADADHGSAHYRGDTRRSLLRAR